MLRKLPFFYGWLIVGIVFVTVGISVSARTSFSLIVPPLIDEFQWERGLVAGAFSAGFLLSAVLGPMIGRMMDRYGPAIVVETGVICVASGLVLARWVSEPWHLYATLGLLVVTGANFMSYTAQSMYLPNWFQKHRALAISLAFSGAGIGGMILLPLFQNIIGTEGWRQACFYLGLLTFFLLAPLNLLLRRRPEDLGLHPDGQKTEPGGASPGSRYRIVDPAWVAVEWTLSRAMRTARFWWIAIGYFSALFIWYVAQVHQTKYLLDIGFSGPVAAQALGLVVMVAIPGQILLGALSDRIGREAVWALSSFGFAICFVALIVMRDHPSAFLLYLMVVSQGFLGYAMTSVLGPIVAEIFEGPHFGSIFGVVTVALIGGGAVGPWVAGEIHDATGSYDLAFKICLGLCVLSGFAVWKAAPRKVRSVVAAKAVSVP
ncbi:MFS transporter [Minwuia sp.]|uniref:MFS transporter n=1 Tax=Minwuia sp. TaxID=2493630 RepID=UPI003A8F16BF